MILNNHSILVPAYKGALDLRDLADGKIQARIRLGEMTIGGLKLSSDRTWLAMEQRAPSDPNATDKPERTFDVGVWNMRKLQRKAIIPECRQLLAIGNGGNVVVVVRGGSVKLWDPPSAKCLKSAPFKTTQIDAVAFSPDGPLLASSDQNHLILWHWEANQHQRIDVGRAIGSLAFSPDSRFLAEGPPPGETIEIRDLKTQMLVQTLTNRTRRSMNIPTMADAQGGRVLIACDNITLPIKPMRRTASIFWHLEDGSLAQELALPTGLPQSFDVSPNRRYLVTMLEENNGPTLSVWRPDGNKPEKEEGATSPAAVPSR